MSAKYEQVLKPIEELESKKQQAIEELLSERERIDNALNQLGYKKSGRGRPAGTKNKATKKSMKKAAVK